MFSMQEVWQGYVHRALSSLVGIWHSRNVLHSGQLRSKDSPARDCLHSVIIEELSEVFIMYPIIETILIFYVILREGEVGMEQLGKYCLEFEMINTHVVLNSIWLLVY